MYRTRDWDRDQLMRYEYRDRERELYERERARHRDYERDYEREYERYLMIIYFDKLLTC